MLLPEQSTGQMRVAVSFDVGNGVASFDCNTSGYLRINHTVCCFQHHTLSRMSKPMQYQISEMHT